jgi:hypothetical protein
MSSSRLMEPDSPKRESAPVEDRTEELRSLATQCLALASTAADPQVRASMMLMARRFHELATRPGRDAQQLSEREALNQHTKSAG